MNKKIKLSLLGTLIAGSALAVTLPIVSCSASTAVVLTHTLVTDADVTATAAFTLDVQAADAKGQQAIVTAGHKISTGPTFDALVALVTFVEKDTTIAVVSKDAIESFEVTTGVTVPAAGDAIPAGTVLTVNLKGEYSTDTTITITLGALGNAK